MQRSRAPIENAPEVTHAGEREGAQPEQGAKDDAGCARLLGVPGTNERDARDPFARSATERETKHERADEDQRDEHHERKQELSISERVREAVQSPQRG